VASLDRPLEAGECGDAPCEITRAELLRRHGLTDPSSMRDQKRRNGCRIAGRPCG
jgi:hypothetical protein